MKYEQFVGKTDNNSVASFGLNFTEHQFKELEALGVEEIVIAFDRQYHKLSADDDEYVQLVRKLERIHKRFTNDNIQISFILDTENLLDYKDSPVDKGAEVFMQLYRNRFVLPREEGN